MLAGGLWRAHADPNQLEVAIINLAVNARDAMPTGGKLTIETANAHLDERYAASQVEVLPGYIMLAVTDNGTGMPADVKAKAFDPFFTTKDIGQGTGLGLSQVYGFVKQSRGHVKIYSEVGEGTTSKFICPASIRRATTWRMRRSGLSRAANAARLFWLWKTTKMCGLIRAKPCASLAITSWKRLTAGRPFKLEAHPEITVLFTDVGLPGEHKWPPARRRGAEAVPNLKVLFTTGYARNAIVHEGRLDPGVDL